MANRSVNSEYVLHPKEETVSAAVYMTIVLIFIPFENNSIVADLKLVIFCFSRYSLLTSEIYIYIYFCYCFYFFYCVVHLLAKGA